MKNTKLFPGGFHPLVVICFLLALLFLHLAWIYPAFLCSILGGLWHGTIVKAQRLYKGRITLQNATLALTGIAAWLIYLFEPGLEVGGLFAFSYTFGLLMLNLMEMKEAL